MKMRIKTKKGWIARDFVIAGLLFSAIITFFALYFTSLSLTYGNNNLVSESFSQNYDKLSNIGDKVESMRSSVATGEGLSFIGIFDVAFTATFTVIQLVFSTLSLIATIPAQMIVDFTFIDSIVIADFFILILAIITTTLVFVWISSVSRSKI